MFEKREQKVYRGVRRESVYQPVCDFWARQGFYVAQVSPFHIQGTSYYQKIGLRREFWLRLDEQNGDTYMDLMFSARISDEGLIGGAAAAVIFFPVAVVGGAISYGEYEEEARRLMGSFWSFADQQCRITGQSAAPSQPVPPPQPPTITMAPCGGCGALIPENWKACPYCGNPR
jgi:hypothetical protein